jgi:hypothetical protein
MSKLISMLGELRYNRIDLLELIGRLGGVVDVAWRRPETMNPGSTGYEPVLPIFGAEV